jgi:hypothetical protein
VNAALRACGVAIVLGACATLAYAQQAPVVARGQILLTGVGLVVSKDHQTVPRNIATSVDAKLVASGDTSGTADPLQGIPPGATVQAELRGPAFGTPVTIVATAGMPLEIPPLAIVGTYVVENIRLVSDGVTLLEAAPDTVTIDVIDKIIVSQVTTRALTASEIAQKGIFVDQTNFDVVNFTAAFGITGQQKTIDFPMILPKHPSASLPASPAIPGLPSLTPAAVLPPPQALPQLQEVFHTNNISVSGLTLKIDDDEVASQFSIPAIPGVIIIPGNIAYLHQFFSVLLMVSNVAPGGSNLVVRDATATIVLPPGADTVPGTDDDPLRMARVGNPPLPQSASQLVVQAGPDGAFGTPDDIPTIAPAESGNSEFLVEGRKEGTQTVQMQITATLDGLPIGPVKISGFATGIVEVRNPTFSLTLSHPATVTAGESYDLMVTVTNTSDAPANQVSVNLSPNSISGAVLDSDQSVTLNSIAAHDAATATFRLTSQVTGNVTATSFTSDDSPAAFVLRTAVGALGIPLSPNSLVLPPAADNLPSDLRMAGVGLLGQAFALATSPAVPAGLAPITQQVVYDRATAFAQAGQRVGLHDSLARSVEDLTLDMLGHGFTRLSEHFDATTVLQAQADYQGFDTLFRQSARGETLLGSIGAILRNDVQTEGAIAVQNAWAEADASGAPFLTVTTGTGSGGAPVVLRMVGPGGGDVGQAIAGGPIARNLPYADFLMPVSAGPLSSQFIVDAVPASGIYTVQVNATVGGAFDLGLTLPAGQHLRHVTFTGVSVAQGSRGTLTFDPSSSTPLILSFDDDGDGIVDRTVAATLDEAVVDVGPTLVSGVQVVTSLPDASQFGQVVGLLFSEELSAGSSDTGTGAEAVSNYIVPGNQVVGAALQPGGRIVLLSLRDGVGPLIPRSVTATGLADRLGNPLAPAAQTTPISMTIGGNGVSMSGVVRGAGGAPVAHARLQLSQTAPVAVATGELAGLGDLAAQKEVAVTVKDLDATGTYSFDFVRQFGLPNETVHLQAINLDTGESADVQTQIGRTGQHLDVDIVFVGTGTLAGRALAPDGVTPLAGAVVRVSSLTKIGQAFGAVTDVSGAFVIAGIPAGNFTVQAAHAATNSQVILAGSIPTAGSTVVRDLILVPLAQTTLLTGNVKGQVFHAADNTAAAGVAVYSDRGGLATTDAAGSYEIDNLPAGPVRVTAIDQANLQQGLVATTVVGNATVIANLLIVGGTGTITGVVVSPSGQPVPNALIGGGMALVRTDAAGTFTLQNVPVGSHQISALDEATQATASASVNLLNAGDTVNVRLAFPGTGSIAGRVFQADGVTAMPQLTVFLLGGSIASTVTDANGGYRFDRLPIGPYKVSAFLSDFSDGNIADSKIDFAGEVHTTDVVARGKGRVTGTVFAADGQTPLISHVGFTELQVKTGVLAPTDNPQCLPSIDVGDQTIELPKCQTVAIGFESVFTRTVDTDAAGTFAFENVFTGPFTVEAANGFSPAIIRAAGTIAHAGDTVNVVLKLQPTSSITGVVFEPDGVTHAAAGIVVTFNSGTLSNVNVVTDANGVYSYPLVNPGGFSVTASEAATGLVGRTDGTVDAGATAHANIRLLGKGPVKVTVSGANGVIQGATVTVTRGTFPNDSVHGDTGPDGSITFAGGDTVTEGPFSVSAFDPSTGITGYASGSVPSGGTETDVQLRIDNAAGSVHGRFLMPDDATPIPNAQVQITSVRGQAFATTDTNGAFALEGVFGGFTADAFDPVTARRGRVTGTIATNQQDVVADIIAVAEGTVSGVVRFSNDSRPAAAADVTLVVNSVFGAQLVTSTGIDGSFTFPGVSAGPVTVQARDPLTGINGSATTSIQNEGDSESVDISLQVPQRGVVQGTVLRADGTPAIGAQVSVSSGAQTTVDNSGGYAISDVPIGNVTVTARAPIGLDGGVSTGTLAFDGDVATIGVRFIGTGTVSATVRAADGSVSPFASVSLSGHDALGRAVSEPAAQANAQGTIQFTGIPVGSVSVTAVDPATGLAGSASGALAADGSALALVVTLQPAAAIRARVLHEDKTTPGAGLAVELNGQSQRFGSTASDGTLAFDNLALGQYDLVVSDPLGTGIVKAAVSLTQQGQTVDLGTLFLHETAPKVQQIVPIDGVAGVAVTQPIQVAFSAAVDAATVTPANLRVTSQAGLVAGAWTLSPDGLTATFVPAPAYHDFTSVSVRVTTAVTDVVGRALTAEAISTFTTADSVPPVFVSRSPASGGRDVASNATIRVGYSEAIDPARFSGSAIALSLNGAPVSGRVDFALSNTVAIFTPDAPLVPNSLYSVSVLPAADVYGNVQPQGSAFTFSTLDTIAPTVDAIAAAGGTTVKVNQTASISATVSAADVASVDLLVNGILVQTLRAAPFTFAVPVTASLGPAFTVAVRATDLSGNVGPLRALDLTVAADQPPTVSITSPADGGVVDSGASVTVSVHGADDVGIAQIGFQAVGAAAASSVLAVNPPSASANATFHVDVPSDALGGSTITLKAAATDTSGQSSSTSAIVLTVRDTTPPATTVSAPANDSLVDPGQTIAVIVAASDPGGVASVALQAGGAASFNESRPISPAQPQTQQTFSVQIPQSARPTDRVTLSAVAVDAAGNASPAATVVVTVRDSAPPEVTLAIDGGLTAIQPGRTIGLTAAASDAGGVAKIGFDATGAVPGTGSTTVSPAQPSASTRFTLAVPADAPVGGTITLTANATDASGNVAHSAAAALQIVGDAPPTVHLTSPASGVVTEGQSIAIAADASDDVGVTRVEFRINGASVATIASAPYSTQQLAPAGADGSSIVILAIATDTAGQTTSDQVTLTLRADSTRPQVVSTAPADGATGVSITAPVTVTFSESLSAATVTSSSFTVAAAGQTVQGVLALSDDDSTVHFTPSQPLPLATAVTVSLTNAITDRFGNALADASGAALTAPLAFTFTTGAFAITSPAVGTDVIERSHIVLEANAAPSLGIAAVVFTINGRDVAATGGPIFTAGFDVPSSASAPTLTIVATGRDQAGNQIAQDTVTVNNTVGLQMVPSIVGIPVGGASAVRIQLSSALSSDLVVTLRAIDSTIVRVPTDPVVIPAGATGVDAQLAGLAAGGTTVLATSTHGSGSTIASVSVPVSGQTLTPMASSAGLMVRPAPVAAELIVAPATQVTVGIRVTAAPAATDLPVSATSSDESIARVTGAPVVAAGRRVSTITFATGNPGVAAITVQAGSDVYTVLVVVGAAGTSQLATVAPSVGAAVEPSASGQTLNAPHAGQTTTTLRLLSAPAAVDTVFTVTSSNPSVATVTGPVVVHAGQQTATVVINFLAEDTATLFFSAGGQTVELRVGAGASAAVPPTTVAPSAGVAVRPAPIAAAMAAATASQQTILVRLLDAPAAGTTPVVGFSTDPSVATIVSAGPVPAGSQVAAITIQTGVAGTAGIELIVAGQAREIRVVSGGSGEAAMPAAVASPVGVAVQAAPLAGLVIAPSGATAVVGVRLLAQPASSDVVATITNGNPGVAAVAQSIVIRAGQQVVQIGITPVADGVADLTIHAAGQTVRFTFISGTPPPGVVPIVTAPIVGVRIQQ